MLKGMRWIIASLLFASPAAFAENEAQSIAFTEGRYIDAASLSDGSSSPDDLAFSARSLLAEAVSAPDYAPPKQLLEAAETKARAALALDPTHVEGRLQLAIALSLTARPLSNREAMRTGYAEEGKALADAVLVDDPDNTYAHGFLAVWHLEVRRRGGAIGASIMGASVRKARRHYEAATQIAPDDASIHWQYARALTALNAKRYRDEIRQTLEVALGCQTETTLEGLMKDRAMTLQAAMLGENWSDAKRMAAQML